MSSKNAVEEFRVVIFYDRIASVGPAMAAYSHLTRELEDCFSTELRLWRTDVASSPECSAEANENIRSARMVIMAFRRPEPVQSPSWEWSDRDGGGQSRCPVAALLGTAITPHPSRGIWNHILRGATAQIQMDIFLWVPQLVTPTGDARRQTSGTKGGWAHEHALTSGGNPQTAKPTGAGSRPSHCETRQLIESGAHGARLFRVTRPDGHGCHWETETTLGANSVNRRFASELHARAWLASSDYDFREPTSLDLEEMNGRFRSPSLVK